MTLTQKAERFMELHRSEKPLLLPNAWDAASARIFEDAGFPAIGTTSAGIANALGYRDGERISREEMLEVVGRIAAAVDVPVTADMEAGYGDAGETVRRVIEAGAVGLNLEDSDAKSGALVDLNSQCEAIRHACGVASDRGIPVVLNARTDVFWRQIGAPETRLAEAIRRLRAYSQAGARCVFAPGIRDESAVRGLVQGLDLPLNILYTAGGPSIARLAELGVARVSIGSAGMRAVMGFVQRMARELLRHGSTPLLSEGALNYNDANALFRA
jgi:2-methylisocitrate lyase-like PEP mutase family enzyme